LTVSGTPATTVAGNTITLTSAGGTGTDAVSYATTGTVCQVTGTSLTTTAEGTCAVTATKGTQTATATFQFTSNLDQHGLATLAMIMSGMPENTVKATGLDAFFDGLAAAAAEEKANPRLGQATLTVSNTPLTGTVGTNIALTTSGGSGTGAVTFSVTGTGCSLNAGTSLKATAEGTCIVTATKWLSTGYLAATSAATTFRFTTVKTVTFNANGGIDSMAPQSASTATATPLTTNAFTRSGFVFDGWATTSTGDKAYGNGDTYSFGENVTLYARWAAVTVPGAPGLTSIARKSGTDVWVTFSAPSSTGGVAITEYSVMAVGPSGGRLTLSFPAQAGMVSVGPLNSNGFYKFTVRAVNSAGTSTPSNMIRYLKSS
jgi:uncharacterized repeat protein (TIGR02543 family)